MFPNESDTFDEPPQEPLMALVKKGTGIPVLKLTPALVPKYQLLNSPWENPKNGIRRDKPRRIQIFTQ